MLTILDRPYFRQDQLTPISASSDSRSISPRTPGDSRRSPYGQPRVGLSNGPPSPAILSSNIDDRFPPFPGMKPSQGSSRRQYGDSNETDNIYAPLSPRVETGGLLKRMDSIAPGPFDISGNRGPLSSRNDKWPQRQQEEEAVYREHAQKPSMSSSIHSNTSNGSYGRLPTVPDMERPGGYGGFGPPQSQQEDRRPRLETRAQTFPREEESRGSSLYRSPSEPHNNMRSPSNGMDNRILSNSVSPPRQRRPSHGGPDRSRAPPPRGASYYGAHNGGDNIPPVPTNINLAAEFGISNPYHTPSISQSSNESSGTGTASSKSSPPSARSAPRRKPSDTSNFDSLMKDLQSSMVQDTSKELPPAPNSQFARSLAKPLAPSMLSPESPMDPAIHGGHVSPLPSTVRRPPPIDMRRRPTTAKGDCKACRQPIKGKSVSSADGRLTGRYHKECFTCTTCIEPFATSTFYVLDDAPYCERHYHKLNNSCCHECDRGIEGQYLETERRQKYHPNCLTCTDCRRTLKDDYFEMNGKVYCERDAWRKAQQRNFLGPGSTNKMERRTTRMMMM